MPPQLIFGTSTFGMDGTTFQSPTNIAPLLQTLHTHGIHRLDTAARYPPRNPGRSEQLLGAFKQPDLPLLIDTKVLTRSADGASDLTAPNIRDSVAASLSRLGVPKVNVLYAHRADLVTDVREQAAAFNEQVELGHCAAWGVSNHSVEHLTALLDACEAEGLKKPAAYQGHYNAVTRGMEEQMLPLLRSHGITFVGYSPAAGGMLTTNVTHGSAQGTRFDPATNPLATTLSGMYDSDAMHAALRKFQAACQEHGVTAIEVAIRWVYWHSSLGEDDAIILGASKVSQVEENLRSMEKGKLDGGLVEVCEELWRGLEGVRGDVV